MDTLVLSKILDIIFIPFVIVNSPALFPGIKSDEDIIPITYLSICATPSTYVSALITYFKLFSCINFENLFNLLYKKNTSC